MGYYEILKNKTPKLNGFPDIDAEKVTDWANSLFKPYLFHREHNGTVTISCSACGKSGTYELADQTITGVERDILSARHNDHARCPWCEREARVKHTRHIGKGKAMEEYIPIMILTAKDGALYARGYWAWKNYNGNLMAKPLFMGTYAYVFRPGLSTAYRMDDGRAVKDIAGPSYGPKNHLPKPHTTGEWCYRIPEACEVYGAEELKKTHLRYIKSEKYIPEPGSKKYYDRLVDVLALANAYPVATELIMRCGQDQLINEMVYHVRKNAEIINWTAEKPKELLKNITWKEFQTATEDKINGLDVLKTYEKFQKRGRPEKLEKIKALYSESYSYGSNLCDFALKNGISLTKADNYIQRNGRSYGGCAIWPGSTLKTWEDTMTMAKKLGFDTQDEAVLFPKDLFTRHNHYAELERERLEAQAAKESLEREREARERLETWAKKYELEACGYRIILPRIEAEIKQEGATLRHCVAGYAERHMLGKMTILFLRRSVEPAASLYTIEMNGNRLVQIHGYRNDWGVESPRKTMAWFIEPWLKWIQKGSPRDKAGKPKIKINVNREELTVAV